MGTGVTEQKTLQTISPKSLQMVFSLIRAVICRF
nr:MAG TPA: hypothetical protein [Caudoviricetes sp.]